MKITLFFIILSMALQNAAQEKNKSTVHITKVESVNGVSKVTDTTYSTDDPTVFFEEYDKNGGKNVSVIVTENLTGTDDNGAKSGTMSRTVIYSDTLNGEGVQTITSIDSDLSPEMLKALEESHSSARNGKKGGTHAYAYNTSNGKVIVASTGGGSRAVKTVYVVKRVKVTGASEEETKRLKKEAGPTNGKLSVEDITFAPNPANGKFNLSFSTPGKGDAEITILTAEGKKIYNESLPGFGGNYSKEIDLSENPKGVYFVRIRQGEHSQMKKLIIE